MVDLKVHLINFPGRFVEGFIREMVILEFNHDVTAEEAIREAEKQGLVYTSYEDVDYFGVEYPDMQKEHPVVFVHEGFTDSSDFPYRLCLGHIGDQRKHISFAYYNCRDKRFAFTRKK